MLEQHSVLLVSAGTLRLSPGFLCSCSGAFPAAPTQSLTAPTGSYIQHLSQMWFGSAVPGGRQKNPLKCLDWGLSTLPTEGQVFKACNHTLHLKPNIRILCGRRNFPVGLTPMFKALRKSNQQNKNIFLLSVLCQQGQPRPQVRSGPISYLGKGHRSSSLPLVKT